MPCRTAAPPSRCCSCRPCCTCTCGVSNGHAHEEPPPELELEWGETTGKLLLFLLPCVAWVGGGCEAGAKLVPVEGGRRVEGVLGGELPCSWR